MSRQIRPGADTQGSGGTRQQSVDGSTGTDPAAPGITLDVNDGAADRVVIRRRSTDRGRTIYITVNASEVVRVTGNVTVLD